MSGRNLFGRFIGRKISWLGRKLFERFLNFTETDPLTCWTPLDSVERFLVKIFGPLTGEIIFGTGADIGVEIGKLLLGT